MTPIYQSNFELITARWPSVADAIDAADITPLNFEVIQERAATLKVNGIQLSSTFDPIEEAFEHRSLTSGNDYHIWGLGLGHLPALLTQDRHCQSIAIYLYNLPLVKLVLSLVPLDWLNDDRVTLRLVDEKNSNINKMTAALTYQGSVILPSDKFISKQTHQWLFFRMENTLTMQHVHRNQLDDEDKFILREQENTPLLKKLPSIDRFLQYRVDDAICIGAGPSLGEHIEELKAVYLSPNRPRLIAAATACKCLLENGIKPDVVYAIDFAIPTSYIPFHIAANTILIAASRLPHDHIKLWHGEKYYLHLADETYDRFNKQLPTQFRPYVYGSVIHPMIHTTLMQGAKRIGLIGCDFGFPNEIIHASMENDANDHNSAMGVWTENGHGELIKSSPTYRMFATGVETIIAYAPNTEFYNWSRMGSKILGARYRDELTNQAPNHDNLVEQANAN
ncbi:motility associated factor glycosyltransferase family protein [Vibrio sp. SM6]|uniref:Motility associated factor glycosyltransferase family protein n=1 Tax=Vibrio agarilyticus TaxID=2726741 RepID=A0A7X8TS15_9VIBR|nr:6-hydroxymethylpterin diphosphokinase MptE-like protein [Vibrio agarilyticus]NLS13714.1 motility associated factor glycosyltransferase family protein [Vibrio agarilyticus]